LAVTGVVTIITSKHKLFASAIISLTAGLIYLLAPAGLFQRFHNIEVSGQAANGDQISARTHVELLKAGLRMIEAHPMCGVGLDQFESLAPKYNPELLRVAGRSYLAHNTYLQIGAECGLPILMSFLILLGSAMLNCRTAKRHANGALSKLALAFQIGLVGFCVAGASVSAEYVTAFWLLTFLSQNLCEIVLNATRTQKPAIPSPGAQSDHGLGVLLTNNQLI
jgi:O-antigen ligase